MNRFEQRGTRFLSLDEAVGVTGTVVVVDVLRAFTTAATVLQRGATRIVLVRTVKEAFGLREAHPEWLLMGEADGLPIPGFDLSNSPAEAMVAAVEGRTLVHRTTSGTQAVALAVPTARRVFCASLVCARATARALPPDHAVTYVISGLAQSRLHLDDASDDRAVAELIDDLRFGPVIAAPCAEIVRGSKAAASLRASGIPEADIELSTRFDVYPRAMEVSKHDDLLVLGLCVEPTLS